MKMNCYYLNLKKKKNNFQVIIINNLAFFIINTIKDTEKKSIQQPEELLKNIFHCMNPNNA